MKRIVLFAALALALALALAACSRKEPAETAATTPESTAPAAPETAPPATPPADQAAVSEPAPPPPPATSATPKPKAATTRKSTPAVVAQANTVAVPAGTVFDVSTITPMDTRTANVGDRIEARLVAPIVQDGVTIAEEGAILRGEISQVQRPSSSRAEEDRASLSFVFTAIQTVEGEKALHATVTNAEGKLVAGGTGKRDALIIGGSTVAGAVLGKVIGKDTKDAVIGGVAGAVVGTGIALTAKGHNLEVPAGSRVQMRVDEPITIVAK
jgi:hypothetical protein